MTYQEATKVFMFQQKENIWNRVVNYHGIDLELGRINVVMKNAMNDPDVQKQVRNVFTTYILNHATIKDGVTES